MTASATPIQAARRPSMTPEPLLLNTERLHRVDASQLRPDEGVAAGYCRTDMGVCMRHPACADTLCPGHPCNDPAVQGIDDEAPTPTPPTPRTSLLGWVVVLVVFALLALAVAFMGPPQDH